MRLSLILISLLIPGLVFANSDARRILAEGGSDNVYISLAKDQPRYLKDVIACLKDEKHEVRARSAKALRIMDTWELDLRSDKALGLGVHRPLALEQLAAATNDKHSNVRQEAIVSMVYLLRVRNFERHGEPRARVREVQPLVDLGRAVVPTLCRYLDFEDEDDDFRLAAKLAAVRALRGIKDPICVPYLIRNINKFGRHFCYEVALALAQFTDPQIPRQVIDSLEGRWKIPGSMGALSYLELLRELPLDYMVWSITSHKKPGVRAAMVRYFQLYPNPAALNGIEMATRDPDEDVRDWAVQALGAYPHPKTYRLLIQKLNDKNEDIRLSAIESLGELADPNTYNAVAKFVRRGDWRFNDTAIKALIKIDRNRAVSDLMVLLEDSPPSSDAILALTKLYPEKMLPFLLAEIRAGREDNIYYSAQILSDLGTAEAAKVLVELFVSSSRENGGSFGYALKYIGQFVYTPLISLLPKLDYHKRMAALEALADTKNAELFKWLKPYLDDPKYSEDAVNAAGKLGNPEANPIVLVLASSPDEDMAASAVRALGELKAQEAVPMLLKLLEQGDNLRSLYSAEALGKIGDKSALESLMAAAEKYTGETRGEALIALGRLGEARVLKYLVSIVEKDYEFDVYAAEALGYLGDSAALPALRRASTSFDESLAETAKEAIIELNRRMRIKSAK